MYKYIHPQEYNNQSINSGMPYYLLNNFLIVSYNISYECKQSQTFQIKRLAKHPPGIPHDDPCRLTPSHAPHLHKDRGMDMFYRCILYCHIGKLRYGTCPLRYSYTLVNFRTDSNTYDDPDRRYGRRNHDHHLITAHRQKTQSSGKDNASGSRLCA